ncbi:MAG: hypothetical protein IPF75_04760 [Bacteroidetes bacterium]|nr:hypothetical protein [Bacteroidota bacterium]
MKRITCAAGDDDLAFALTIVPTVSVRTSIRILPEPFTFRSRISGLMGPLA